MDKRYTYKTSSAKGNNRSPEIKQVFLNSSQVSMEFFSMADSSQFSPLTTLSEQLGPNSWVSSVFIPAFIANIGKHFFLEI